MTPAAALQGLPLDAARCIFEFAYLPAQYVDPERGAQLRPAALDGLDMPVAQVSRAMVQTLGLPDLVGLDTVQPLHRAALLPRDAVRELALWVGLRRASGALRKLVLRQDVQALAEQVHDAHWSWVFSPNAAPMPQAASTELVLQQLAVIEWPKIIWQCGWDALVDICLVLPRSIGQRLWLKLPVQTPDVFALATPALGTSEMQALTQAVAQAYEAMVNQWNPQWDSQWQVAQRGDLA